ncbi:DUF2892 domain-containing protein [bacterium]|nr:DUF2892 domain-containing protein [bacterium]
MPRERYIRLIAGSLILASLVLAYTVSQWWLLLAAFVGFNLLQSALTGWCLMDDMLRYGFGIRSEAEMERAKNPGTKVLIKN